MNKLKKPAYNLFQNTLYILRLAWIHKKSLPFFCLLSAAIAIIINLLGLFIAPVIFGEIEAAVPLQKLLTTIGFFAAALMVMQALSSYIETILQSKKMHLFVVIGQMNHEKHLRASLPVKESQRFNNMVESATKVVWGSEVVPTWSILTNLLKNFAGFGVYLLLLTAISPAVFALVTGTAAISFFINNYVNGWGYRHREEESVLSRKMGYISHYSADYTIAKDIRIFGMKNWLEDCYNSTFRLYQAFIARGERVYIWANITDVIATFLRNGAAYAYLLYLVLNDGLTAAAFLLYFSAVGGLAGWVSGIFSGLSALHRHSLDICAFREMQEYPEPFVFEEGKPLKPSRDKNYEIQLRNVSYRYPEADTHALRNINLIIKPGEKLAVVGLNGAGKTTLVKLICGFYDPTDGAVLLNGEDIRPYNRRDYYRHFSAVFQDFSILAASVAVNIAQHEENMDLAKVKACAEKAGLTQKIESLSHQWDTHIGKEIYEGISLSGGETQRLMLARALYKDAPIIVLDEPTAALDPIAESEMYQQYHDFTGGRTSVYISHRLASTRFCDRIILIDKNRIAEEGTHEQLMKANGKYAELFEIQSRYYQEGGANHDAQ